MSRGFHAFFRQYYNLRALLRRADPALRRLTADRRLPARARRRRTATRSPRIPRTPPLNLASFVLRSQSFTAARPAPGRRPRPRWSCSTSTSRAPSPRYDGESAAEFLDRLRFPDAARHLALEVFARSFFADPAEFAAGELVAMFHTYFLGSAEGLLFDVPDDDYDTALWAPLGRYLDRLRRRGPDRRRRSRAVHLVRPTASRVETVGRRRSRADAVVLAADPAHRARLIAARRGSGDATGASGSRRAATRRRSRSGGSGSTGPSTADGRRSSAPAVRRVDNVSVLERFEAGAAALGRGSTAGRWSSCTPTRCPGDVDDDAVPRRRCARRSTGSTPRRAARGASPRSGWCSDDCPLVGTEPVAPTGRASRTPDPRVVLAGDGVRCDYPVALMERAATTGFLAANRLLTGWGLAGHDLWTVPMRGRHAAGAARCGGAPPRDGAAVSRQLAALRSS